MEAWAAALPYTAELTPDAVAMWTFFFKGRAILLVLPSLSMAWFCLGILSAERMHAPATWITPRSLNQSATFGPERLPRR
eukprot:10787785-Heterocapsa_arctica.AAC.1